MLRLLAVLWSLKWLSPAAGAMPHWDPASTREGVEAALVPRDVICASRYESQHDDASSIASSCPQEGVLTTAGKEMISADAGLEVAGLLPGVEAPPLRIWHPPRGPAAATADVVSNAERDHDSRRAARERARSSGSDPTHSISPGHMRGPGALAAS